MPRSVSPALQTLLNGVSGSFCIILDLERTDGEVFYYSNHNRSLTFDGNVYTPNAGLTVSAFEATLGSDVDNQELSGITSDEITERDIRAGLFNGARMTFRKISWADPSAGSVIITRGHIGNAKWNTQAFRAEFRSISQVWTQQFGVVTQPGCRVKRFADAECRLNEADFQHLEDTITNPSPHVLTITNVDNVDAARYVDGFVRFTSGDNDMIERLIKNAVDSGANLEITLQEPFPFDIDAGTDTVILTEGCDHSFATCVFLNNAVNYQGEPHLPGNLKLMERGR